MFGNLRKKNSPLQGGNEKFETLIGPQAVVQGNLRLKESVRVDGMVIGDIEAEPDHDVTVVIGVQGQVQGNITANFVVVAGHVVGNILARERVELPAQCRVEGDIRYTSIAIEHGATILGLLLHRDNAQTDLISEMTQKKIEINKK